MLLLLLLFALCADAKIEWKFTGSLDEYENYHAQLEPMSIGTPGQKMVGVYLDMDYVLCPGLWVAEIHISQEGFNTSASSTYKNLGRVYRRSALGQDNMVITFSGGADQHLKQIEFGVNGDADDCYSDYNARLSLAHSTPKINNSFLESIFAHEKEPVAVVTFYNIPNAEEGTTSGLLTLGERPAACEQKWTMVDEVTDPDVEFPQWNMKLDKITVGKFAASGPGTVVVNFDDELFEMPREIHDQVARALNVNPENGIIPCDSTQNITFTIGGLDLVLTPRDYVGRSPEGDCIFLGIPAGVDKFFNLPYTILRDRCLLLDYKNNQIGFANKK